MQVLQEWEAATSSVGKHTSRCLYTFPCTLTYTYLTFTQHPSFYLSSNTFLFFLLFFITWLFSFFLSSHVPLFPSMSFFFAFISHISSTYLLYLFLFSFFVFFFPFSSLSTVSHYSANILPPHLCFFLSTLFFSSSTVIIFLHTPLSFHPHPLPSLHPLSCFHHPPFTII